MSTSKRLIDDLRIEPRSSPNLARRDPDARIGARDKEEGLAQLTKLVERLGLLHNRLFAEAARSVLLVLQGMDAAGKDGTIRSVLTGVNPQGCRIVSFREPTTTELAHDYLCARPPGLSGTRGRLDAEHSATSRLLSDEGTAVVKVFLHVSREEQRIRLQERLDDPEKRWKFRVGDLDDRRHWDDFTAAYEDALRETSTECAPWYVVPADHNWSRNLAVAEILVDALERLDPRLPRPDPGLEDAEIT